MGWPNNIGKALDGLKGVEKQSFETSENPIKKYIYPNFLLESSIALFILFNSFSITSWRSYILLYDKTVDIGIL